MGAVISPVPPSSNGSDVHNLWGSGSAQPGWAPTCSQLDGCERRGKRPEGDCPELPPWPGSSALFPGKSSIQHWRRGLGLTLLWARFPRRQGERSQLVLLLGVALVALRLPSLGWGAFEQPRVLSFTFHPDAKLGYVFGFQPLPHQSLEYQLAEGQDTLFC